MAICCCSLVSGTGSDTTAEPFLGRFNTRFKSGCNPTPARGRCRSKNGSESSSVIN